MEKTEQKADGSLSIDPADIEKIINNEIDDKTTDAAGDPAGRASFESLEKTAGMVLQFVNSFLKEKKNLPGWKDELTPTMAQLSIVVAERNIPATFLERSPEIMLASLLGTIAADNMLAAKMAADAGPTDQEPEKKAGETNE